MRSAANVSLIFASITVLACAFAEPASASWRRDMIIGADSGYCRNGRRVANVQAQCPEFQKNKNHHKGNQKKGPGGGLFFNEGTGNE